MTLEQLRKQAGYAAAIAAATFLVLLAAEVIARRAAQH